MNKKKIAIISQGRGGMLHYALDLITILEPSFQITLFTTEDISMYKLSNDIVVSKEIDVTSYTSAKQILNNFPNFDIYHFTSFHPSLYSLLFLKRRRLQNVLFTVHDCNIHPYGSNILKNAKLKFIYSKYLMLLLFKKIDNILCLSSYVAGQVNQKFNINPCIIRLPNYSAKFAKLANDEFIPSEKGLNILVFGSIEKYKGIEKVIDIINFINKNDIKDIHFTIAGRISKDYLSIFETTDNVTCLNRYILDEEINSIFSSADFLLAPYTEVSQSGVVSLAIDYKLSVIASDIGSFSEYINENNDKLFLNITPEVLINFVKNKKNQRNKTFENLELSTKIQLKKYSNLYNSLISSENE